MSKAKCIIDIIFNQLRTLIIFISIIYKFNLRVFFFPFTLSFLARCKFGYKLKKAGTRSAFAYLSIVRTIIFLGNGKY